MTIFVGLVVTLGCMLGGFAAMGGHIYVIWQPWEYVIILGASLGTFIVANPIKMRDHDTTSSKAPPMKVNFAIIPPGRRPLARQPVLAPVHYRDTDIR